MTVAKNGKYYHYDFWLDGARQRGSTQRATKREAEAVEASVRKRLLDRTQHGVLEEWSTRHAIEQWIRIAAPRLASGHDRGLTLNRLIGEGTGRTKTGVRPFVLDGDLPLHTVDGATIVRLRDERVAAGQKGATINREMCAIRGLLTFASERGVRVAAISKWPHEREASKARTLSAAEEAALLRQFDPATALEHQRQDAQDNFDLVVVLLDTGMRKSEALGLTWEDADFDASVLNIWRAKTATRSIVPMTRRVRAILRRRQEAGGRRVFPRGPSLGAIRRAFDKAGLNDPETVAKHGRFGVHCLRHAFASRLVQRGMDLYKVQTLLGHTGPAMTQRYAHLRGGDVAVEAASLLETELREVGRDATQRA